MQVGQKVICIDNSMKPHTIIGILQNFKQWVVKDKIYTIREILDNDGIVEGLLLEEIHNPPIFIKLINREQEPAFGTFRFRLLNESELKAMSLLNDIEEPVEVKTVY